MREKIEMLLEGIIAWMRTEGVAPTRTRIVKFLYLADLQYARYHDGKTFTGWRWYTDSFGPFATEALRLLDEGVNEGWLRTTVLEREEEAEVDDVIGLGLRIPEGGIRVLHERESEDSAADAQVILLARGREFKLPCDEIHSQLHFSVRWQLRQLL